MKPKPTPGVCRFCSCTESTPCSTPPCGEPCAWTNRARTVCSAPKCQAALADEKRKAEYEARQRNRKRTPAEIHDLIRRKRHGRRAQRKLKGLKPGSGEAV